MAKMKTYSVQLTEEEYQKLLEIAKYRDRSVSYIIREAVQDYLTLCSE